MSRFLVNVSLPGTTAFRGVRWWTESLQCATRSAWATDMLWSLTPYGRSYLIWYDRPTGTTQTPICLSHFNVRNGLLSYKVKIWDVWGNTTSATACMLSSTLLHHLRPLMCSWCNSGSVLSLPLVYLLKGGSPPKKGFPMSNDVYDNSRKFNDNVITIPR